jgi:Na+/alanine symporter
LFAVFTVIAAFGIGNMFQAKAVTASVLELVPEGTPETPIRVACGLIMARIKDSPVNGTSAPVFRLMSDS